MSAYIIAAVFLLLILMAGYLFLAHSIEKRRAQRQRLITALRARRNSFRDLTTGFPAGFLSTDLMALLYRALVDCCEQLARIEPNDPIHAEQLVVYTNLLASLKEKEQHAATRLDNPKLIKEAHGLLQELHKFVQQQAAMKQINEVQAAAYNDQISRMLLQLNVDHNIYSARQAQQAGKLKLAIHYYQLGRKTLAAKNVGQTFNKQIGQIDGVITRLKEKLHAEEHQSAPATRPTNEVPTAETPDSTVSKEWKQFDEENEKWKKKQIYDE